jgi:hypothetical protein
VRLELLDECASCGHGRVHHGHIDTDGEPRWVDQPKCWVYVDPERTATGRRKGKPGCKCTGWRLQA